MGHTYRPKALTRIRTCSFVGFGTGRVSRRRTSGPPASCTTAAFIVAMLDDCVEKLLSELLYELITNMYL